MRSDAEGYVHRPADGDDESTSGGETAAGAATDAGGFGRRGWVLVAVVVLSVLVIPGLIYAFPAAPADAGLPFLVAMLVLPMLPAALLGATAVWSMTAATRDGGTDGTGDDD